MLVPSYKLLFGKLPLKCLLEDYFQEASHFTARIMLKPIDDPHVDLIATVSNEYVSIYFFSVMFWFFTKRSGCWSYEQNHFPLTCLGFRSSWSQTTREYHRECVISMAKVLWFCSSLVFTCILWCMVCWVFFLLFLGGAYSDVNDPHTFVDLYVSNSDRWGILIFWHKAPVHMFHPAVCFLPLEK